VIQEEFIGFSGLDQLPFILERYKARRILIVKGKNSFRESGAERLIHDKLEKYTSVQMGELGSVPTIGDVTRGVEAIRSFSPDMIVAIGGGNVLDVAKLMNIFAVQSGSVSDYLFGKKRIEGKGKPLVAIPTTAGSGSEATHFAVIYVEKKKYSVAHGSLIPEIAIVDPALTRSLSAKQTAFSGMDALCQAIESFWCIHSTQESKSFAGEAIGLVNENLIDAVRGGTDDSRLAMAMGAHLAGKAINITKTTAPHALSYPLTAWFGVPHGQAVSLTLAHFLEFNYGVGEADLRDPRGVDYVRKTMEEIASFLGCSNVLSGRERLVRLMREVEIATTFSELGIDKNTAIEKVLDDVNVERLVNNPREVSKDQMRHMLEYL
jgi:alcohol dehydrogenase class IV